MARKRTSQKTLKRAARGLSSRLNELGWKPSELADRLGVADSIVSRILSANRPPSLIVAVQIQRSEIGLPADVWVDP